MMPKSTLTMRDIIEQRLIRTLSQGTECILHTLGNLVVGKLAGIKEVHPSETQTRCQI